MNVLKLKDLKVPTGIGILLGIILVLWVEPVTGEGVAVLIAVTIILVNLVAVLIRQFRPSPPPKGQQED